MIDEDNPAWMRLIYALEEIAYRLTRLEEREEK